MAKRRVAILAASLLVLSCATTGCFTMPLWKAGYSGDGKLTDHGFKTFDDRYEITLGKVDVSKVGRHQFRIGKLPHVFFILEPYPKAESPDRDAAIRMVVTDNKTSEQVINKQGKISDWNWRGPSQTITTQKLARDPENIDRLFHAKTFHEKTIELDIKASEGWGSMFRPRRWHTYTCVVEVLEPSQAPENYISILGKGGGWVQ